MKIALKWKSDKNMIALFSNNNSSFNYKDLEI